MLREPAFLLPAPAASHPPRDPARVAETHALIAELARFPTLAARRAAADGPALEARLAALLDTVHLHVPAAPPAPAADPARLHVAHWNIEHGNWYAQVEAGLTTHPALAGADLVLLNEVDLGCARAQDRDVTADLADALGLYGAFAPMFVESTLGRDDDARCAAGRTNQESLVGIAVLSRWPFGSIRLVELPGPESIQFDLERMAGRFIGLVCEVLHPVRPFVAVSVHLEVHRARAQREVQMRRLLAALAGENRPVVLAGDFNSHTFDRGLWHSTWSGALPLVTWPPGRLRERLTRPDRGSHREGVFDALAEAGFAWRPFNDFAPTLDVRFERLDELRTLPAPLQALVRRGLVWLERRARLRLDWIVARGFAPEPAAHDGRTALGLDGPGRASDHAPIAARIAW